ncbi:hypothetical protein U0070_023235 [Myodes glareolus]|uniref:Uncharacterized protein n=1 Tax=Myodes glareolus TaxID=447135 RepID=A0AAW0HDY4_MYOGA
MAQDRRLGMTGWYHPVGTAALVDKGASEEAGGPDLAAPEVKGDGVGKVTVGVCEDGLGPEVTLGFFGPTRGYLVGPQNEAKSSSTLLVQNFLKKDPQGFGNVQNNVLPVFIPVPQITELQPETPHLLPEERMQQECAGPLSTSTGRTLNSRKGKSEAGRDQLLISASKAVESLAEVQQIHVLEEDVKAAQAELEKAFAETETEKLGKQVLCDEEDAGGGPGVDSGSGRKGQTEELNLSLKSREVLIQCLKEEKSQMASPDENVSSGELHSEEAKETDIEAAQGNDRRRDITWKRRSRHFRRI